MAWMQNILLVICGSCMVFAEAVLPPKCAAVLCAAPTCPKPYTPPGECCPVCRKGAEKPGTCPIAIHNPLSKCAPQCEADSDCPDITKCCESGCGGRRCRAPITKEEHNDSKHYAGVEKPGTCPIAIQDPLSKCAPQCEADSDCPDITKCCDSGCGGRRCRTPITKGKRCVYKESVYKDGQTFKDDCNTCTCTNGNVACTEIACNYAAQ